MSYREIDRLRNLFERDIDGLVNPTQRLILIVVTSYEGKDGCYVGSARLEKVVGLKSRALLENMHHLTDGSKWEKNKRVPCSHPDCVKKETHLKIIKRNARAYKGTQQNYTTDLDRYEYLLSMRHGAPIEQELETESMHLDTDKGALEGNKGSALVHPYRHERHERQLHESSFVNLFNNFIRKQLPTEKLFRVDSKIVELLHQLESKGFSFKAVETALEAVGADSMNNPKAFTLSRLQTLVEGEPDWSFPDRLPPHCGHCEVNTRTVARYEIPSNPPGLTTNQCPNCNPYAIKRRTA